MKKRKIIITVTGILLLVAAVFSFKLFSEPEKSKSEESSDNPKTAVNVTIVKPDTLKSTTKITGRVLPTESVNLYAEVNGIANYGVKPFKAGVSFK